MTDTSLFPVYPGDVGHATLLSPQPALLSNYSEHNLTPAANNAVGLLVNTKVPNPNNESEVDARQG